MVGKKIFKIGKQIIEDEDDSIQVISTEIVKEASVESKVPWHFNPKILKPGVYNRGHITSRLFKLEISTPDISPRTFQKSASPRRQNQHRQIGFSSALQGHLLPSLLGKYLTVSVSLGQVGFDSQCVGAMINICTLSKFDKTHNHVTLYFQLDGNTNSSREIAGESLMSEMFQFTKVS